ncbi:MAG: MATE family efflux transporter [Anaerolineae bacterium]|nr:MATE family efflux transporter [Anaerolineae bacterium]
MVTNLFNDKNFFRTMLTLSMPIIIQNLITFSLGAVDMLMIGQLGDKPVAAVGLADQIFFLMILMMFGISSGAAIFTAQYWGKKDIQGIHSVLSLSLMFGALGSVVFMIAAIIVPETVLSIYTQDAEVIALGSEYLRIVGWSYIGTAVAVSYTFILRSIENVKLPMIVGAIALVLNTTFNYLLIFGNYGFPEWGVAGAAIATCGARLVEAVILVSVVYWQRLPLAAPPRDLVRIDWTFLPKFGKTAFPVIITEVAWSLGITTYAIIYARISTEAIAAVNIVVTIERMAFIIFLGMSNACAIMIGNRIGANEINRAYIFAKRYLALGVLGAVPVGLLVIVSAGSIMTLYNVSETVSGYAIALMTVMGLILPIKVTALMIFIGVLRSGGDTNYSMILDGGSVWLIGVPLAFIGAFFFELPVYWVYMLVVTEEIFKVTIGLRRIFKGPWIHYLTEPEMVAA